MENKELDFIRKAKAGDADAMETLVKNYWGLVRKIVRKYFTPNGTEEDLIQYGLLGIPKAIKDYDMTKNDNFAAFAALCIDSKVKDGLRELTREKHGPLNDSVSITALDENGTKLPADLIYDPVHHYIDEEGTDGFYKKVSTVCTVPQVNALRLFLEGYSYTEIARMMGIPTKKVDNILYNVKNKIKKNSQLFL